MASYGGLLPDIIMAGPWLVTAATVLALARFVYHQRSTAYSHTLPYPEPFKNCRDPIPEPEVQVRINVVLESQFRNLAGFTIASNLALASLLEILRRQIPSPAQLELTWVLCFAIRGLAWLAFSIVRYTVRPPVSPTDARPWLYHLDQRAQHVGRLFFQLAAVAVVDLVCHGTALLVDSAQMALPTTLKATPDPSSSATVYLTLGLVVFSTVMQLVASGLIVMYYQYFLLPMYSPWLAQWTIHHLPKGLAYLLAQTNLRLLTDQFRQVPLFPVPVSLAAAAPAIKAGEVALQSEKESEERVVGFIWHNPNFSNTFALLKVLSTGGRSRFGDSDWGVNSKIAYFDPLRSTTFASPYVPVRESWIPLVDLEGYLRITRFLYPDLWTGAVDLAESGLQLCSTTVRQYERYLDSTLQTHLDNLFLGGWWMVVQSFVMAKFCGYVIRPLLTRLAKRATNKSGMTRQQFAYKWTMYFNAQSTQPSSSIRPHWHHLKAGSAIIPLRIIGHSSLSFLAVLAVLRGNLDFTSILLMGLVMVVYASYKEYSGLISEVPQRAAPDVDIARVERLQTRVDLIPFYKLLNSCEYELEQITKDSERAQPTYERYDMGKLWLQRLTQLCDVYIKVIWIIMCVLRVQQGIMDIPMCLLVMDYRYELRGGVAAFINLICRDFAPPFESLKELDFIEQTPELPDPPAHLAYTPPVDAGGWTMAFEDVHWTRQGVPILRGLSFTIPANQVTAIVGLTGSGKSTIAKLLLRLEGVTTGRVTLNGHDLCNVTHNALRSNVNYVEQTPQFFESKSVAHNLGYATASTGKLAGQELVEEAAKLGHIYDAIKEKPEGFEANVGSGLRSTFSGGEQHRIAISRALLKPKPLLVLDEATSALDSATEERVMESIRKHCGTVTTTVIIAHRLSTVKQADQIVVIDKGQVAQVGTHTTLYADKEGIYSRLWAASGVTDGSGT